MIDECTGASDSNLKINLVDSIEDVPSPIRVATSNGVELLETAGRMNGGAFGRFACTNTQLLPDVVKDEQPSKEASQPIQSGSQRYVRLGSLKTSFKESMLRHRPTTPASWGPSSMEQPKRQRDAQSSDDDDEQRAPVFKRLCKRPQQAQRLISVSPGAESPADRPSKRGIELLESTIKKEPAMRVRIDANRNYGPKMADLEEVGEVLEEDAVDDVLRQCEEISNKLKKALGSAGGTREISGAPAIPSTASPELLLKACGPAARYVKSYQLVGINFLLLLASQGVEGSILADEMGLGKTAQTICFLGCLRELQGDRGPHLVICPASLIENWQRELLRWCPSLSVVTYYGKDRSAIRYKLKRSHQGDNEGGEVADEEIKGSSESEESEEEFEEVSEFEGNPQEHRKTTHHRSEPADGSVAPFDVMITSYTLFERDSYEQKLDRNFLKSWPWSHLILDEAHAVKNSSSMRTVRLNRLAENCRRRIMLTGTPLQNDLEELQNLLRFMMPKLFTADEAAALQKPQDEEETKHLVERMQGMLRPFMLRRLKTEVANQLTPKQHKLHKLEMTAKQNGLYAAAVADLQKTISLAAPAAVKQLDASSDPTKRKAEAAKAVKKLGQKKLGNAFVVLRKLALHPLLARNHYSDSQIAHIANLSLRRDIFGGQANRKKILDELMTYSDFQLHSLALENGKAFEQFVLGEEHLYTSTKCQMLAKLLPELKEAGSRPLIFSQWVVMLDILEWLLQCMQLPYVRLDGSTAVEDRLTTVDMFNNKENGVFAFLLSTRAGGQGLNLTGADTVILHDVDWNPQVDRQAEDRCHRLGQTRPVTVIRLVTKGTVDEGIYAMAQKKLQLDAAVLDAITTSTTQTKAAENAAMGELLQSLIAGDPSARPLDADGRTAEVDDQGPETLDISDLGKASEEVPNIIDRKGLEREEGIPSDLAAWQSP